MKKLVLSLAVSALIVSSAQAGVFGVVKHLVGDGYHGAKYLVVGVAHGVKHAAGDVKTVAK